MGFAFSPSILTTLWASSIVANGIAAWRIYQLSLHRVYRCFFVYLAFAAVRSLILFVLPAGVGSNTYAIIYFLTAPILWIFYVLVVLELYSLVLRNFRGIHSLGRWTLYAALPFSIAVSVLTLIPSAGSESSRILFWCLPVERGVVFSLVVFLLLILAFLSIYPVELSRNILIHCVVYTVFFLGISAMILIRNVVGSDVMHLMNTIVLVMNLACYGAWAFLLTRENEQRVTTMRHNWTKDDEQRLIGQLNVINATLLRAAHKQRHF